MPKPKEFTFSVSMEGVESLEEAKEIIVFHNYAVNILRQHGYHVNSPKDALYCIQMLCKVLNRIESNDAMLYTNLGGMNES